MTLQQIKKAVARGLTVHWQNEGYTVTGKGDDLLITWAQGTLKENSIGLTHKDGVTVNGQLERFYVAPKCLSYAVDESGAERRLDEHTCRENTRFVGFRAGFELVWVAVLPFQERPLEDLEAADMAIDLLLEKNWFADNPSGTDPEFII